MSGPTTEITVLGGERYRVDGEVREVERLILDAARGSIMQLAWFTDSSSRGSLGVNPAHVVTLRDPSAQGQGPPATGE